METYETLPNSRHPWTTHGGSFEVRHGPRRAQPLPLWALDEIGHRWKRLLSTYMLWEKTRLVLFDFHALARRQRPPGIGGVERI